MNAIVVAWILKKKKMLLIIMGLLTIIYDFYFFFHFKFLFSSRLMKMLMYCIIHLNWKDQYCFHIVRNYFLANKKHQYVLIRVNGVIDLHWMRLVQPVSYNAKLMRLSMRFVIILCNFFYYIK